MDNYQAVNVCTNMSDYYNADETKAIHILGVYTEKYKDLINETGKNTNNIINADINYVRRAMIFYKDENDNMKLAFLIYPTKEEYLIMDKSKLNYFLNFELNYKNKKSKQIILVMPDTGSGFPLFYETYFYNNFGITEKNAVDGLYHASLEALKKYNEIIKSN